MIARLSRKAISAYERARLNVDELIRGDSFEPFLDFVDEIENCIFTTNRVLRVLHIAENDSSAVELDLDLKAKVAEHNEKIQGLRDRMEHLEGQIQNSRRYPANVWFTQDTKGVKLGDASLSFVELADELRTMHQVTLTWLAAFCGEST